MRQRELLRHLVDVLERLGRIPCQRLPLVPGVDAWFARPEDVILYKLLYHQQVESGVHLRDVLGIIRVSGPELDETYVRHWADQLGVRGLWDGIRKQAE
jgi:hypothetical protein